MSVPGPAYAHRGRRVPCAVDPVRRSRETGGHRATRAVQVATTAAMTMALPAPDACPQDAVGGRYVSFTIWSMSAPSRSTGSM